MPSRPIKIQDLPIDWSVTLQPTKILHIHPFRKGSSPSPILDLTPYVQSSYDGDITPIFQNLVQTTLEANPQLQPAWHLQKTTTECGLNTRVTITQPTTTTTTTESDESVTGTSTGTDTDQITTAHLPVAYINSHLLSYGASHIHFVSGNISHDITVKPVSIRTRAQTFVKDSATYIWERTSFSTVGGRGSSSSTSRSSSGRLSLCKALAGKKIEVARYASTSGKFEFGGLLVVEEREVEPPVAILTLLGVLAQTDAYYMPGLDLVGKRMAKNAR